MKRILFFLMLLGSTSVFGQQNMGGEVQRASLPKAFLGKDVSLHFLSPEKISYADISTKNMVADIPVKNVLRIKIVPDSLRYKRGNYTRLQPGRSIGVVTIVGERYIAQYDVYYSEGGGPTQIEIMPANTTPLDVNSGFLSQRELQQFALQAMKNTKKHTNIRARGNGIEGWVNNVYTIGNYILVDIEYENNTNLPYDIDAFRFKIEDKRINKATNVQAVEIKPVTQLYEKGAFKKRYRNVFAFNRFTFPNQKVFTMDLTEKQISGRRLTLRMSYADLLDADTL